MSTMIQIFAMLQIMIKEEDHGKRVNDGTQRRMLNEKFDELVGNCMRSGAIDLNLYQEYDVKRGLRDSNGKGVLTGLTEISDVNGFRVVNGVKEPADGQLYYQGYDVKSVVGSGLKKRFCF